MICGSPLLNDLDAGLGKIYKSLVAKSSPERKQALQDEQRAWIGQRDENVDESWFAAKYKERIDLLSGELARITAESGKITAEAASPKAIDKEDRAEPPQTQGTAATNSVQESSASKRLDERNERSAVVSDNSSVDVTSLVVALVLVGAVILVVLLLVKRVLTALRRRKKRGELKNYYTSGADIGKFHPDQAYIDSHLQETKRANKPIQCAVKKLYIPLVECETTSEARWSADIGEVDQAAYSTAMGSYQVALSHYETAKAQFEAQESAKWQNSKDGSYHRGSWGGTPPDKPAKKDFVVYKPTAGFAAATVNHSLMIGCQPKKLDLPRVGLIDSPFVEATEKAIFSIYRKFLPHLNGSKAPIDSSDISLESTDEEYLLKRSRTEIESALVNDAKKHTGEYCRGLRLGNIASKLEFNAIYQLPVAVVASIVDGKSLKVTLHDHLAPQVVIR